MVTRRDILMGAGAVLATSALPAAATPPPLAGNAFGTTWRVVLPGAEGGHELCNALARILADVDREMSPFRADSEISRFNAAAGGEWFSASPGFCEVTRAALATASETDGAFDPTLGPLVSRYGFGPVQGSLVGLPEHVETAPNALRKHKGGLSLDLCGIAKGHAVDRLAAHLTAHGHERFLIEIGGDILARGMREEGRAWRVGIENPLTGSVHRVAALRDTALATSGDRVHAYELKGRRYSHTIDPATGEPVRNAVASVSVLAPDAITADALSTALMVMGPERGLAFADANAVPALFLLREDGALREAANPLFHAHLLS